MGVSENLFYDITLFSSDEIVVGEEYNVIAEMYFRIKSDAIQHSREVFTIMDWLGSIGGIRDILVEFLGFLFGNYIQFNAVIQAY